MTVPVLAFTKIDVGADKATVTYRYDIENLRGSCSLAKRDGAWQLLRSRLVQNQRSRGVPERRQPWILGILVRPWLCKQSAPRQGATVIVPLGSGTPSN